MFSIYDPCVIILGSVFQGNVGGLCAAANQYYSGRFVIYDCSFDSDYHATFITASASNSWFYSVDLGRFSQSYATFTDPPISPIWATPASYDTDSLRIGRPTYQTCWGCGRAGCTLSATPTPSRSRTVPRPSRSLRNETRAVYDVIDQNSEPLGVDGSVWTVAGVVLICLFVGAVVVMGIGHLVIRPRVRVSDEDLGA
jgi:hypothetical protein